MLPSRYLPVRHVETGVIYPSITHAFRALGLPRPSASNVIAIYDGRPARGHRFELLEPDDPDLAGFSGFNPKRRAGRWAAEAEL